MSQYVGGVFIESDALAEFLKERGFVSLGVDEEAVAKRQTHRIGKYGAWNYDKSIYYVNENYPVISRGRKDIIDCEPVAPGKWVEEKMFYLRALAGEDTSHQAFLKWMQEQRAQHKRIIFRCVTITCKMNLNGMCRDMLVNHGGSCTNWFRTEREKKEYVNRNGLGVDVGGRISVPVVGTNQESVNQR